MSESCKMSVGDELKETEKKTNHYISTGHPDSPGAKVQNSNEKFR